MWQKESSSKSALYINLCAAKRNLDEVYRDVRSEINAHKKMSSLYLKCDATSQAKRKHANMHFKDRNWEDAIEYYNEALCFAEKGSKCMGLAFANRSACFFNMKLYDQCLIDIELAKQNNYPKSSIPELEKRKLHCQKLIASGMYSQERTLQLDFMENEQFPGMANVIEISKSADGKHAIYAKQNIEVGKIVAIDKCFTKTLFVIYGWKCNLCLRSNTNLVPCKKCTTAMFCHGCKDNDLHEFECGMKTSIFSSFNNYLMQELRTFFVAINLFENVDEMMNFVEQSINSYEFEIPNSLKDDRSKYRAFLKLVNINTPESRDKNFAHIVFCVYKILLEIPKVQTMFKSKKHRRFLMHLVGHHIQINLRQSYTALKDIEDENGNNFQRKLYSQVGVMLGYFKHSCAPNVYPIDFNGDTIYTTIRPIQAGQQLFLSNVDFHWNDATEYYYRWREIDCKCEKIYKMQYPSSAEIKTLLEDSDFVFIKASEIRSEIEEIDRERFDALKEKCLKLLNKYGNMVWCSQLNDTIKIYTWLLKAEINGAVQTVQSQDKLNNNS